MKKLLDMTFVVLTTCFTAIGAQACPPVVESVAVSSYAAPVVQSYSYVAPLAIQTYAVQSFVPATVAVAPQAYTVSSYVPTAQTFVASAPVATLGVTSYAVPLVSNVYGVKVNRVAVANAYASNVAVARVNNFAAVNNVAVANVRAKAVASNVGGGNIAVSTVNNTKRGSVAVSAVGNRQVRVSNGLFGGVKVRAK